MLVFELGGNDNILIMSIMPSWVCCVFMAKAVFGCCKTFSGKYIFSGNANFRKRKIFPCVWLHFKKFFGKYFLVFGKEEGKHKSRNTSHNPKKTQTQFKFFLSDLSLAQSRGGEIATNGAISRRRDRVRHFSSRARACSLSLSHFPEMLWRENRSVNLFLWSKDFFFWVNGFQFPENRIFRTNQTASFPEKHFRKWFSPKTNTA